MDRRRFLQGTAGGGVSLLCAPALGGQATAAPVAAPEIAASTSSCSRYVPGNGGTCRRSLSALFDLAKSRNIRAVRLMPLKGGSVFSNCAFGEISLYLMDDPLSHNATPFAVWRVGHDGGQGYQAHFAAPMLSARYVRLEASIGHRHDDSRWGAEPGSIADVEVLTDEGVMRTSAVGRRASLAARFGPSTGRI